MGVWAPMVLQVRTCGRVRVARVGGPWRVWWSLSMRTLAELLAALVTAACTTFGSVILRINLYPREHEWSLLGTDPSEIEMSDEEGTGQLSEEVIQAVEERILKKLQVQLEAQHKVKEGGR